MNARQHKQTQGFIQCIAETLLKPIDTREAISFDQCTITKTQE